jgi:hypothetical protein
MALGKTHSEMLVFVSFYEDDLSPVLLLSLYILCDKPMVEKYFIVKPGQKRDLFNSIVTRRVQIVRRRAG